MINDFFLTEWFFDLLRWLYSVLGNNYFLTIFIVTLALRIIQLLPDINNRKNQRKQAKIQPEIEKLKKKYADNPQKLSMEQNKLMRENGIGMLSSCLPLLLTLPLFFCFLAAFRFWGYEQTVRLTYETIVNPLELGERRRGKSAGDFRQLQLPLDYEHLAAGQRLCACRHACENR